MFAIVLAVFIWLLFPYNLKPDGHVPSEMISLQCIDLKCRYAKQDSWLEQYASQLATEGKLKLLHCVREYPLVWEQSPLLESKAYPEKIE